MKIVVDTNVLISATFWYGDSDLILNKAEKKDFVLILSKAIMEEYVRVLQYKEIRDKIKNKNLEILRTVQKIASIATIVDPAQKLNVVEDDPDDNKVIECAVESGADFIVTQDQHLLKLQAYGGIKILPPREFLVLIAV